jgi:DNA-binding PadR family transcriptional regulator
VFAHILALKDPQTIYDIHRELKTRRALRHVRYASVNKRVRSLEESGYIKKTGVKKTKAGFEASIYELTARAYLAILLNSINLNKLVMRVDEATSSAILAAVMYTT